MFSKDLTGYLCRYARDAGSAYFYCGSTSTTKAIKVRACQAPGTLVSLGYSFAKDDRNVYLEAKTIKGADPATFKRINAHYWCDVAGIGFLDRRVPDADPATFEPIDAVYKSHVQKAAAFSPMGRDKDYVFESGRILSEEDRENL